MAHTMIEGEYTDGKIELNAQPPGIGKAHVYVIFVEDETTQAEKEQERKESIAQMVATMRSGIRSLNGGPYYTSKEELYEDRMDKLTRRPD